MSFEARCRLTPAPEALPRLAAILAGRADTPVQVHHRLVWTLFGDVPGRKRDFLYLVEATRPFTVIVRGHREPRDHVGGLWEILRVRPFAPHLEPGMRLRFRLRAVPVTWVRMADGGPTRRQDVVMAAWMRLPPEQRADPERRATVAENAARDWLARTGRTAGFSFVPEEVAVFDYDPQALARKRRGPDGRLLPPAAPAGGRAPPFGGAVNFEGRLRVDDPGRFREALLAGFGRARAFGFGLMLIAREREVSAC